MMRLGFNVRSTREDFTADTKKSFEESIHDSHGYYPFHFDIYIDHDSNQIAEVHGFAFSEKANYEEYYSIDNIADDLSADAGTAIYTMLQSDEFNNTNILSPGYSCFIESVFVVSDFRGIGIGRYIFVNLGSILQYVFNINTRCFTIIPTPQMRLEGEWEEDADLVEAKKEAIIKVLEKCGYQRICTSDVWGYKCSGGFDEAWRID